MRGLTVRQPFAHAIIHAGKHTENRLNAHRWRGVTGETIAIHAGLRWTDQRVGTDEAWDVLDRLDRDTMHYGAIIGTVRVSDVHWAADCCDPWGQQGTGICHLSIDNPRPCEPIPLRGNLGLWRVPDDAARLIEAVRA